MVNLVGPSEWSPESYLVPALTPTAPPQLSYTSVTATEIALKIYRSTFDGGLPITDYIVEMDEGDLLSDFAPILSYDFSADGYALSVAAVENGMTAGLLYRFRAKAYNSLGWSDYSDTLIVGLGPLPTKVDLPTKSNADSSPTTIMVQWTDLSNQILPVSQYSLYMDDGFGESFSVVFTGTCVEYLAVDLTPNVVYSFFVTASNFNGEGPASDILAVKSCVPPFNVRAPELIMATE